MSEDYEEENKEYLFVVRKAPFGLRPFSFLINPYDHACSVLCNHPHGNRFSWMAKRLALLAVLTGKSRLIKESVVRCSTREPNILNENKFNRIVKSKPRKKSFSFLKEYREIYEIPKSALETNGRIKSTNASNKRKPKRKKIKVTSAIYKRPQKNKVKRKRKKKKNKKKMEREVEVEILEKVEDEDGNIETLTVPTIRKRRNPERKKFIYSDLENPSTLVEKQIMDDKNLLEESLIENQYDLDLENDEFDPNKLKSLQLLLVSNPATSDQSPIEKNSKRQINLELKNIKDELNNQTFGLDSLMKFPKLPSIRCCRFELPMDTSIMKDLKPMEYLKKFCIVPSKREKLCETIFKKYRNSENLIIHENILKSFGDAFGQSIAIKNYSADVCMLIELNEDLLLDLQEFIGVIALAERYLCKSMSIMNTEQIESKDTIEELDFNYFDIYQEDVEIYDKLKTLLLWIKNS